jgi:hypothetical protein
MTDYEWDTGDAAVWLAGIEFPQIVIPASHDGRNVGCVHFRRHFGELFSRFRAGFDPGREERLRAIESGWP